MRESFHFQWAKIILSKYIHNLFKNQFKYRIFIRLNLLYTSRLHTPFEYRNQIELCNMKKKKLISILLLTLFFISCSNDYENDFSQYWEHEVENKAKIEVIEGLLDEGIDSDFYLGESSMEWSFFFQNHVLENGDVLDGWVMKDKQENVLRFEQFTINQIPVN